MPFTPEEAADFRELALRLRKLASECDAEQTWMTSSVLLSQLIELGAPGSMTAAALATALYRSIDASLEHGGLPTSATPEDDKRETGFQKKLVALARRTPGDVQRKWRRRRD